MIMKHNFKHARARQITTLTEKQAGSWHVSYITIKNQIKKERKSILRKEILYMKSIDFKDIKIIMRQKYIRCLHGLAGQ
jgi:hypothetical protein